jgi:hypothetical protein
MIGIVSEDFKFLYDVSVKLKRLGVQFRVISYGETIPRGTSVVIKKGMPKVIVDGLRIMIYGNAEEASAKAWLIANGLTHLDEDVYVGIDPGVRPGVAIFSSTKRIVTAIASSPEHVSYFTNVLSSLVGRERVRVRIGNGDPTNRDRIIRAIWKRCGTIELVDERRTSRLRSHEEAATLIGMSSGVRVTSMPEVRPSEGEIREIQRRSRLRSGGLTTISRSRAVAVARGESSMEDAIRLQMEERLRRGAHR